MSVEGGQCAAGCGHPLIVCDCEGLGHLICLGCSNDPDACDCETDELYLRLLGARERLCVAQTLLGDNSEARAKLGEAVELIDEVGSKLPQWSEHDRDHEL